MNATICKTPESANDRRTISAADDGELLVRYAETGDRSAFEELVHRYEREIYNYLRKYLGDQHLAEDAFQATFLQLHRKCSQFEPGRELRPWLYRIAANQANDLFRRNRRHQAASLEATHWTHDESESELSLRDCLSKEEREPHELLESAEDCRQIASAVDQLPDWLKQPVLLVVYQGLKYRDAAKIIGIPLGTLKSRLYEAVRRVGKLSQQPAERRAATIRRAPAA
ncbi:MAG TPA: RNA polymerase sigma factor [Pirellulales bacterium]|jgi:RNA polymerase sigma-70 factor (ECF subfamily)|nr:RNA polymerase sigma factor [Pirellulales bacterium]